MTYYISGHLDITEEEFQKHYIGKIDDAIIEGASFVVGDDSGADSMAQHYLKLRGVTNVTVFHMFEFPRNNENFPTAGGYFNDTHRDTAMTEKSDADIAWVRPGREKSGTAKNLKRREKNNVNS